MSETGRKQREHPYTNRLNRIKSKICYYKKHSSDDENDEKIKALEYERFILKLNPHDISVIKKFCTFNNLTLDVEDILKQFLDE